MLLKKKKKKKNKKKKKKKKELKIKDIFYLNLISKMK